MNDWNKLKSAKPVVVATLSATGYEPVGVAVGKDQTVYASSTALPGSQTSGVLVYAPGSTTPTGLLSDPAYPQAVAAGIAIDPNTNDVYWVFNKGGSNPGIIDVFRGGIGPPHLFISSSAALGDVRIDLMHHIVTSFTGGVAIFDKTGHLITQWSVAGVATSISLNKTDTNIYVVDTTNLVVSKYKYPSGQLVTSGHVFKGSHQLLPGNVYAYPAQK